MKDALTPELLHELCHDLRGPLGAIGTWVSVLKSDRSDAETRTRALTAMSGDVRAMGALIDQVSALAEAISGPGRASRAPIDLVPFMKSACLALSDGGPELPFRADETSLMAVADPVRLRQIVELFASAAPDAAPEPGSRALSVSRNGQTAEVMIETRGTPGILVVHLARALAEAQGGAFEESLDDGTTRLKVLLPLAP